MEVLSGFEEQSSYQLCADGYNAIDQDMRFICGSMEKVLSSSNRIIDTNEKLHKRFEQEKAAEKDFNRNLRDHGIED